MEVLARFRRILAVGPTSLASLWQVLQCAARREGAGRFCVFHQAALSLSCHFVNWREVAVLSTGT